MLTSGSMPSQFVRPAAVAGSWYPASPVALARDVDRCLAAAAAPPPGDLTALIAPHAGLMYSGAVAAHAYRALYGRRFDVAVLVGPSHYVPFEGVASSSARAFETPLGPLTVASDVLADLARESSLIHDYPPAHAREHALEMQLPFLARLMPDVPIVPLVMGAQTPPTIVDLAGALARGLAGRRALLVASTDLSHYHDARTALLLDQCVIDRVSDFDAAGLLRALEQNPGHACGGGPMVSVMMAARRLGARNAAVLRYADSGDVSGDKSAVVGYLAAAFGTFDGKDHPS
jgi:AmmeMemoRadiSam system protein B